MILDIEMAGMDGLDLARALREVHPKLIIIFLTGYEHYALDAYRLHSIAYLVKPVDREELAIAVEMAEKLWEKNERSVYIRTFGHFDVFANGELVLFKRAKAKELLALLVDRRGGLVTMEQATMYLWEDQPYDENVKKKYRDATSQLRKTLAEYGVSEILRVVRGGCCVVVSEFHCDYYALLDGDPEALTQFNGMYMTDYSWGEDTLAEIAHYEYE